jgi:GTP cyclohydrolase II
MDLFVIHIKINNFKLLNNNSSKIDKSKNKGIHITSINQSKITNSFGEFPLKVKYEIQIN